MKIVVIDGQGGGIGRAIVEKAAKAFPNETLIALGANASATEAMLKAGAKMGATGENAICVNVKSADYIAGPMGIVLADSLLGEITSKIACAVASSPARKLLVPSTRCNTYIAGIQRLTLDEAIGEIIGVIQEDMKR